MEEYLLKEEQIIKDRLEEIDRRIRNTFNKEVGKSLISEKGKLQKALNKTQTDLLEFKNKFYTLYNDEELKLIEKRFIDPKPEKIFTLNFLIR